MEKMPADLPELNGVSATFQVLPKSEVRSTLALAAAPIPIHASPFRNTAMLVPLAANAPSFSSAGGKSRSATRVQVLPPLSVVRIQNFPSIESPTTIPRLASQNDIASKNAFGSSFLN